MTDQSAVADIASEDVTYVCPMHPQIRRPQPGYCPLCGMALEPILPAAEEPEDAELIDLRRRFWWTLPLTPIVVALAMFGRGGGIDPRVQTWIEAALSAPIVLWAGAPFFARGWESVRNASPNMWT